jgi:hypothetical protein
MAGFSGLPVWALAFYWVARLLLIFMHNVPGRARHAQRATRTFPHIANSMYGVGPN